MKNEIQFTWGYIGHKKHILIMTLVFDRNFLINYMIKIIYFLPDISIRKNNRRLYLIERFFISTLVSYLIYFGYKMEFFIFNNVL